MNTEPHVLVVPDFPAEVGHYPAYTVECPGLDAGGCRAWYECRKPGCPPFRRQSRDEDDAIADGGFVAHGQEHQQLDMAWCTPTDRCFIADHEALLEQAHELVLGHDLDPGRHQVALDSSRRVDATDLDLILAPTLTQPSQAER